MSVTSSTKPLEPQDAKRSFNFDVAEEFEHETIAGRPIERIRRVDLLDPSTHYLIDTYNQSSRFIVLCLHSLFDIINYKARL